MEGLEPTRLAANDFESFASASSATPARNGESVAVRVDGSRDRLKSVPPAGEPRGNAQLTAPPVHFFLSDVWLDSRSWRVRLAA